MWLIPGKRWHIKRVNQAREGLTSAREDGEGFSFLAFWGRNMSPNLGLLIDLMWVPVMVFVILVFVPSNRSFLLYVGTLVVAGWLGSFLSTLIVTRNPCSVTIDDDRVSIATMSRFRLRPLRSILDEPRGSQHLEVGRRLLWTVTFVVTSSSGERFRMSTGWGGVDMLRWSAAILEGLASGEQAEEGFRLGRPAPGAKADRLSWTRTIGRTIGPVIAGVGLGTVAVIIERSERGSLGPWPLFAIATCSSLLGLAAWHWGTGWVRSHSGSAGASPLLLSLSALICVAAVSAAFALWGGPRTEPLAGAGLFEGGLLVFGAPCEGDRLRSIAVIDTESRDRAPLWKVTDPSPAVDAYVFTTEGTPKGSYRLEVELDRLPQEDHRLAVIVETTEHTDSMEFRMSDLQEGMILTDEYGSQEGSAFFATVGDSIGEGNGCSF